MTTMHRRTGKTRQSSIPAQQRDSLFKNIQTQKAIYTTRSDSSDGEITTVRQSFEIVGTIDGDNRNSVESFCDSNKDSGFDGSQDLLNEDSGSDGYSEVKMIQTVGFEDFDSSNDGQVWAHSTNGIKLELEKEVGENENALKEELLSIFDREKLTLGSYFKHRMADMSREFKNKKSLMEEKSRAERVALENEIAQERAEMQKSFADEIAALTHTFNEERLTLEKYYKDQLKEVREQCAQEQADMDQKIAREKSELQEKIEAEAMLRAEIADLRQATMQEATDREERHSKEKLEMERKYNVELTEAEMNTQKIKSELEVTFAQEKMSLEQDLRGAINDLKAQLGQEKTLRIELEKILEQEKVNAGRLEIEKTHESEKLKSELEGLRMELDEKKKSSVEMKKVEEEIRVNGKDGLNGRLREDFDKIVEDYKMELGRNYEKEKEHLQSEVEFQCQVEKERVQEELDRERKKLNEEMTKEREDLEMSLKKFQEEKESKAKDERMLSRENNFEYKENYRRGGIQENERWVTEKDGCEFERHKDTYKSSLDSTIENHDEFSPRERNSENTDGYSFASYLRSCYDQPEKIQVENPSRSENYNLGYYSNNQPFVSYIKKSDISKSYDDSLAAPSSKKDLFYVTPENENKLRSDVKELRRENEGLKAKIRAMEENIDLHRTYKAEVKEELSRLQKDKLELQSKLNTKSNEEDGAIQARNNTYELERRFRESEAKRKDFEDKVKELNGRLSEAEKKSQPEGERVYELEAKLKKGQKLQRGRSPTIMKVGMNDSLQEKKSKEAPIYCDPCTSQQYSTKLEDDLDKRPNEESSLYNLVRQENVYGYPSEIKSKEYKTHDIGTNCGSDSYQSPIYGFDLPKFEYSDRFGSDTEYPRTTRPDLYSSYRTSSPLYGSHSSPSTRFGRYEPSKLIGKSDKPGKYSSFGEKSDCHFETSTPRILKTDRRDKPSSLDPIDHMEKDAVYGEHPSLDENRAAHTSHNHEANYEKAVAERDTLVDMIKELKEKVKELEKEKQRIDNEEYKLKRNQYDNFSSSNLSDENASLKFKVEEMKRKINVLAERLKEEKSKSPFEEEKYGRKSYSKEEIEDLQGKLQQTGDAINGNNNKIDPDVLRKIEKEIKSIGEFIRSHYYEEDHGRYSYRSENNGAKVLQLQMEKQDLEMKLNMTKKAMNDYVGRLNDKMEYLLKANCLSDSTLQEIYDRNASLKETLTALEKGQHKSQIQNEQLKHQKRALQNLIEQLCKPDVSYDSQLSSPRHSEKDGNYDCNMMSEVNHKVPKLGYSGRSGSYFLEST